MSTTLIDLDESGILDDYLEVKIRGQVYKLPTDIPATLYVKVSALADGTLQPDQRLMGLIHNELLGAFRAFQPDMTGLPLGLNAMVAAVGTIYGAKAEQDGAAEGKSSAASPTTRSSGTRKSSGTRSSSASARRRKSTSST